MKYLSIAALGIIFLLTSTGCEKESPFGHLKVTVNYPEAVVVPDQPTYFITVPGVGAEVRLYDKDAHCLGIRDARIDVAWRYSMIPGFKFFIICTIFCEAL